MEWEFVNKEQKNPEVPSDQRKKTRIGEIALQYELVTQEQLDEALAECKETGKRLGEMLINLGFVTEGQINWALSHHLNIPLIENLDINALDLDLIRTVPQEFLLANTILPLAVLEDEIAVAMADPTDAKVIKDLESITGRKVCPSIASASYIAWALSEIFTAPEGGHALEMVSESVDIPSVHLDTSIQEGSSGSSFLNFHLTQATLQNADEIHIDPLEAALWVRYKVNGTLKHKSMESMAFYEPMIQQLRAMGKLHVFKLAPQKAEVKVRLKDKELHLRFSIVPTQRRDAIWIKILKATQKSEGDFLSQVVASLLEKFPSRPKGLCLVASPFLSEISVILSELIKQLDSPERKIVVLEKKPALPLSRGIHLVLDALSESSDQGVLEELLSQNPEVLVLGQPETFMNFLTPVLWEAASSSTLVIGSLMNRDSGEALEDLLQKVTGAKGRSTLFLSSVLRYVLAGTRFKSLCTACQELYIPSAETQALLNLPEGASLYRSRGCLKCGLTGFNGELKLYELLEVDRETRAVLQGTSPPRIREAVLKRMANSIQKQASQKLMEGTLSEEEVIAKVF